MKKQMSFIVKRNGKYDNADKLNLLLNDGWPVSMINQMSDTDSLNCYALVILEKEA
ncbi:hypothetical protein [uncultured Clostridium sp.]|uniref:hypothetical protein n=1 Tax=uncultured Clostridium sp. TaxID=59620 RepID=UPI0028EFE396|nr:hypothetical protein [uncultured Clostridium sp.]